jgi:hypothetical protein
MTGKKARYPKDMKTHVLQIRLSDSDHQAIKEVAKARGLSVADLVRTLIPSHATPEPPEQLEPADHGKKKSKGTREITLPGYPGTFTVKD